MACIAGLCNSGCSNSEEVLPTGQTMVNQDKDDDPNFDTSICIKCKVNVILNSVTGGENCRFCYTCFRSNLFSKFKFAITSAGMISPVDNVLIAFSGGQSSRVALQFLHEMQCRSWKNFELNKDKSPRVFGVGVAFIDESSINVSSLDVAKIVEDMKTVVLGLAPPDKMLHVVPVESLFSTLESNNGLDKLNELLDYITDVTGREDMLLHLRSLCLQKVAIENGYNKIILGSCASRIACHVISETVKGRGYSLPADIQYINARWKVPVLLPLRDCLAQELDLLCHLDGFNPIKVGKGNCSGINSLVSSFVTLLQEENSSRASTIVRTAGKLNRFSFKEIPEAGAGGGGPVPSRRRLKDPPDGDRNGTILAEAFCRVCNSPADRSSAVSGSKDEPLCCRSCRFQILPGDPSSLDRFFQLLPFPADLERLDLRADIQHLLICCEDER